MRILIALIIPPLAVLLCGRPLAALLVGVIWLIALPFSMVGVGVPFVLATVIAAIYIVINCDADKREKRMIAAMERGRS